MASHPLDISNILTSNGIKVNSNKGKSKKDHYSKNSSSKGSSGKGTGDKFSGKGHPKGGNGHASRGGKGQSFVEHQQKNSNKSKMDESGPLGSDQGRHSDGDVQAVKIRSEYWNMLNEESRRMLTSRIWKGVDFNPMLAELDDLSKLTEKWLKWAVPTYVNGVKEGPIKDWIDGKRGDKDFHYVLVGEHLKHLKELRQKKKNSEELKEPDVQESANSENVVDGNEEAQSAVLSENDASENDASENISENISEESHEEMVNEEIVAEENEERNIEEDEGQYGGLDETSEAMVLGAEDIPDVPEEHIPIHDVSAPADEVKSHLASVSSSEENSGGYKGEPEEHVTETLISKEKEVVNAEESIEEEPQKQNEHSEEHEHRSEALDQSIEELDENIAWFEQYLNKHNGES